MKEIKNNGKEHIDGIQKLINGGVKIAGGAVGLEDLEHLDFELKRGDFGQGALIHKNLITIFPFCRRIPKRIGEDRGA